MKKSWAFALIALTLVAGAALVACGGGDDNKDNKDNKPAATAVEDQGGDQGDNEAEPTVKATAKATPKATTKATAKADDSGDSGGSIGDVPVYPDATKVSSSEFSGSQAGGILGSDADASDFTKVQLVMYTTSDSAQQVLDWYKDKMSDWDQAGTFSSGDESGAMGYAAWTKDDGTVAAWISVAEGDGTTTLNLMYGTQ